MAYLDTTSGIQITLEKAGSYAHISTVQTLSPSFLIHGILNNSMQASSCQPKSCSVPIVETHGKLLRTSTIPLTDKSVGHIVNKVII